MIPIEDINQIIARGAGIRLSTMDLSILTENKVAFMTMHNKHLPTALVLPFEGNARQSGLMHMQVNSSPELMTNLWIQITRRKILNQAGVLTILGLKGTEVVTDYAHNLDDSNVDYNEALAAKD